MPLARLSFAVPLVLAAALAGCGADPAARRDEAQAALAKGDFALARDLATSTLTGLEGSDPRLAWSLERIRLEALARGGEGAEAARQLERLAAEYPKQANPELYLAIASYVRDAGDKSAAIDVLVAGDQRFPEQSERFQAEIEALQKAGLDPAETERLKSLGYL